MKWFLIPEEIKNEAYFLFPLEIRNIFISYSSETRSAVVSYFHRNKKWSCFLVPSEIRNNLISYFLGNKKQSLFLISKKRETSFISLFLISYQQETNFISYFAEIRNKLYFLFPRKQEINFISFSLIVETKKRVSPTPDLVHYGRPSLHQMYKGAFYSEHPVKPFRFPCFFVTISRTKMFTNSRHKSFTTKTHFRTPSHMSGVRDDLRRKLSHPFFFPKVN